MKALMLALMVSLAVCAVEAQFLSRFNPAISKAGAVIEFRGSITDTATVYSNYFSLEDFDAESFHVYPISLGRWATCDTLTNMTTSIQGSYDGEHWFAIDTIAAKDTTHNALWRSDTTSFRNVKVPLYRFVNNGFTMRGPVIHRAITFREVLYLYRRDR